MSKDGLTKRVRDLEEQLSPGRARICWLGDEPMDLDSADTLLVLSWQDEKEPA